MQMDLQLVPVFLCLYSICLVIVTFLIILFHNCFALFLFLVNLQYFSPLLQDSFVIFNENLLQSRNEQQENIFHKEFMKFVYYK